MTNSIAKIEDSELSELLRRRDRLQEEIRAIDEGAQVRDLEARLEALTPRRRPNSAVAALDQRDQRVELERELVRLKERQAARRADAQHELRELEGPIARRAKVVYRELSSKEFTKLRELVDAGLRETARIDEMRAAVGQLAGSRIIDPYAALAGQHFRHLDWLDRRQS